MRSYGGGDWHHAGRGGCKDGDGIRSIRDFLIRLSGDGTRLMVLETKGKQLENDDTAFKRDLMAALQDAYVKPSPGEVELFDDSPDAIRFRMLMQEEDWRPVLAGGLQ